MLYEYTRVKLNILFEKGKAMFLVQNIKYLAKQRGITVAELERNLKFGISSISKWEKSSPSLAKVMEVSEYFNCTLDALVKENLSGKSFYDLLVESLIYKTDKEIIQWVSVTNEDDADFQSLSYDDYLISNTADYMRVIQNPDTDFQIAIGDIKAMISLYKIDYNNGNIFFVNQTEDDGDDERPIYNECFIAIKPDKNSSPYLITEGISKSKLKTLYSAILNKLYYEPQEKKRIDFIKEFING